MKGEPGRLFLCDIHVEKSYFDFYDKNLLNWTFHSRHGGSNNKIEINCKAVLNLEIFKTLIFC